MFVLGCIASHYLSSRWLLRYAQSTKKMKDRPSSTPNQLSERMSIHNLICHISKYWTLPSSVGSVRFGCGCGLVRRPRGEEGMGGVVLFSQLNKIFEQGLRNNLAQSDFAMAMLTRALQVVHPIYKLMRILSLASVGYVLTTWSFTASQVDVFVSCATLMDGSLATRPAGCMKWAYIDSSFCCFQMQPDVMKPIALHTLIWVVGVWKHMLRPAHPELIHEISQFKYSYWPGS